MAAHDTAIDYAGWQPMRREHDRIALLELRVRQALFNEPLGNTAPPTFPDLIRQVAAQLLAAMDELLVEIWLRDPAQAIVGNDGDDLRFIAGFTRAGPFARQVPGDLIVAVMTASRPLRFDGALEHPLVRNWATESHVPPEAIDVFLGLPISLRGEILGVLMVAMSSTPSVEHVAVLDVIAEYLAVAAQLEWDRHEQHYQSDLAFTVLREAPLAAAIITAANHTITLTNPRFDHLLHLGPDVWGQRLEVVLPEHAAALRKAWQLDEVVRTKTPRVMLDMPVQLPEGISYWDFTCAPLPGEDGTILAVIITGVDVTSHVLQRQRQKRAVDIAQERVSQMVTLHQISLEVASQLGQDPDALLRQILEKMAQVVNATGGMVYLADRETGDLEVLVSSGLNQDYTRARLKRGEGLAGRVFITGQGQMVSDYRRFPLRASIFADAPFGAVAAVPMKQRGQVVGVICLIQEIRPDGLPSHHRRLDEAPIAFTAEDIWLLELFATQAAHAIENARTYLDLERSYQQQRALDRQKDDFLARASHDLRLPLTSVVGYLDLALETLGAAAEKRTDDDLRPLIQQAADEAQRLHTMLDDMMAQLRHDDRLHAIQTVPLALGPVVEDVVQARRKQIALHGSRHRIFVHLVDPLMVLGDRTSLQEVLENLISNAVKYSPSGGDITIEAQPWDEAPQEASPKVEGQPLAIITIRDQGIGIPPEAHAQIFERFMRVDSPLASEIRGDGIGLYLARQLVESMGGTIWLEQSTQGVGSVFAFTLPLAPGPAASAA